LIGIEARTQPIALRDCGARHGFDGLETRDAVFEERELV
jgi:hypothetical protein